MPRLIHRLPLAERNQAESRTRPFARLRARMARPARLRIRTRKPCVLARRRLLGWKVFFTIHPRALEAIAVQATAQSV
jgi:hypothetical protein